jgi:hypothetical protein
MGILHLHVVREGGVKGVYSNSLLNLGVYIVVTDISAHGLPMK